MFLFAILAIMAVFLIFFLVLMIGAIGAGGVIMFGDVIVCIAIIVGLCYLILRRKES